jgi:hypothetical protein
MGYLTESDSQTSGIPLVPEYRAAVALNLAAEELKRAMAKFGPMASAHEGIAVIREEYLELEREVFWGTGERMREEAVQLAAMALRFLVDVQEVEAS